jgi:hypothetical protein
MTAMPDPIGAELQRDFDRYCERRGLPLRPVLGVSRSEFRAFLDDLRALETEYLAVLDELLALSQTIEAQFEDADARLGPDPHRTAGDVATAEQQERANELARMLGQYELWLGLPVAHGVDERGEAVVWVSGGDE